MHLVYSNNSDRGAYESVDYMQKLVVSDFVVSDYYLMYLILKFDGTFENVGSNDCSLLATSL